MGAVSESRKGAKEAISARQIEVVRIEREDDRARAPDDQAPQVSGFAGRSSGGCFGRLRFDERMPREYAWGQEVPDDG